MTKERQHELEDPASFGVTELLVQWREGKSEALDELTPLVYAELHRLAHRYMRKSPSQDLLQTTALVHEAYLRLVGEDINWQGRDHFFAVASTVMRRILVDFARRRFALKRGGGGEELSFDEALDVAPESAEERPILELLALDRALHELAEVDPRKARILEHRFFAGMTIKETSHVMELSHATVEREMKLAKAWLARALDR
ncbi:MAG: sigma-70 family RNA polymerase sigma factor [Deltaproteobacteria bacterium]|nr:sigma-70 family RNA polymerase sigma factor [Deltaproteobacteria bacterium]